MREIKFRFWNIEKNEMYGPSSDLRDTDYSRREMAYLENEDWMETTTIWEQYTGLCDKNGVEMYEGDIITSSHLDITPGYKWVVEYKSTGFYPFNDIDENSHGELLEVGVSAQLTTFKVIGNIHENPELLKESN